jgi:hypothetical protein
MDQNNKDQIPQSSGPESQTGEVISQQNAIEGQRKEVNVENYAIVAEIGQLLKDLSFPADKNTILEFVKNNHGVQNKDRIIDALGNLEDKSFNNVSEVTTAAGLVYK